MVIKSNQVHDKSINIHNSFYVSGFDVSAESIMALEALFLLLNTDGKNVNTKSLQV